MAGGPGAGGRLTGPDIGPDGTNAERSDFGQVVLERRLQAGCLIQML